MNLKDKPLVSVAIPTKNSGETIETCLKSLKEQTYPNIEVIVVDNYSTDGTKEIAEKYEAKIILCRSVRSKARNVGAGSGKGEFVFSIDSDMELTPNVIGQCVAKVGNGFDAVIIPEISIGKGFWARCRALEKACYIGDDTIEAARFFKRSIFDSLGGYDPELEAGEDWDLDQRISRAGYRIGRVNAFIKHHEGNLSLQMTILKKHYYGKTLKRYKIKHPEEAKHQLRLIRPAFVKNWKELAKDPVHAIGMLFMKACELIAAGLAYFTGRR